MSKPETVSPLAPDRLRWICDPNELRFASTADIEPIAGVIGQDLALEALEFGLDCKAPGQNVFVRGIRGSGRLTMVRRLLDQMAPKCERQLDRCYVHNFLQPDRPRLISLPPGSARELRRSLKRLGDFVAEDLGEAMNDRHLQASRMAIQEESQRRIRELTLPFEESLHREGLALLQIQTPHGGQATLVPQFEGQPVPLEKFDALVRQGRISAAERDAAHEKLEQFAKKLPEFTLGISRILNATREQIEQFNERHLRRLVGAAVAEIKAEFDQPELAEFLDQVIEDVVDHTLHGAAADYSPHVRYGLNVLLEHTGDDSPIVLEGSPSLNNLLGTIETRWEAGGQVRPDYRSVRGGSLLAADGGFLILDAHDVLAEPGAWQVLMRTLRNGMLEIVPHELLLPFQATSLKPEPIPVKIRVILLGSAALYYALDALDYDFADQFKVLCDFDDSIARAPEALHQYAGVLARIAREEGLKHFTPCGVAALAEHGARVVGRGGRVSTRFGRIADIAREADWLAGREPAELVTGEHVRDAVRRTKRRASLPSTRFQSHLKDGTVLVQTRGTRIGQVNGLAVIGAGPLTFGFPARITASIGAGNAGVIDIEGLAAMSGSIHTKGFHILSGLLRHLLKTDHPLAFSASIAFEQSYGGIDGDSASAAEICALLSALTGIPLAQNLAITGAVDQHGRIQAIGGVNEKIEGFFDICAHFELDGTQGVIIPESNADDLMLRHDVVEAGREGRFFVYPVGTIREALELLTGVAAGEWDGSDYPPESILGIARARAHEYWNETRAAPGAVVEPSDEANPSP